MKNPTNIKAIIIDDEEGSRKTLRNLLVEYCPQVEVLDLADSAATGIMSIRQHQPDLVFLDIAMPDGDGFEMLDNIKEINFGVIFTTAYDEYAVQAFEYSAIHYLLKPINILKLQKAVEEFEKRTISTEQNHFNFLKENIDRPSALKKIALPTQEALLFVSIQDIIRCEADGSYTLFYLKNKKRVMVAKTLKHFEDLLDANVFLRVHHAHLINLNQVVKYIKGKGGSIEMSDGSEVEVSVRKKDIFMKKWKTK